MSAEGISSVPESFPGDGGDGSGTFFTSYDEYASSKETTPLETGLSFGAIYNGDVSGGGGDLDPPDPTKYVDPPYYDGQRFYFESPDAPAPGASTGGDIPPPPSPPDRPVPGASDDDMPDRTDRTPEQPGEVGASGATAETSTEHASDITAPPQGVVLDPETQEAKRWDDQYHHAIVHGVMPLATGEYRVIIGNPGAVESEEVIFTPPEGFVPREGANVQYYKGWNGGARGLDIDGAIMFYETRADHMESLADRNMHAELRAMSLPDAFRDMCLDNRGFDATPSPSESWDDLLRISQSAMQLARALPTPESIRGFTRLADAEQSQVFVDLKLRNDPTAIMKTCFWLWNAYSRGYRPGETM